MVDRVRTVDFLPEIFQTPVNKQFLNATLDQLTQEPAFQKTEGFIGRTVGPGVDPQDNYVIEPDKVRTDYQLEPGVVSLDPTATTKITNAITYPGINDAIKTQGGITNNANRLYTSDYYAFDPFIDFDKFVNYSEYYWVPDSPASVPVSAVAIPPTDTFIVTRDPVTHSYTFQGRTETISGQNPTLTLVRGGNYTFIVTQNEASTTYYSVSVLQDTGFIFDNDQFLPNPPLTLIRGNTYVFNLNFSEGINSFFIKTAVSTNTNDNYNDGVIDNGALTPDATVTFTVPYDAPDTLYYCTIKGDTISNFDGVFTIVDPEKDTGPGFWIQQEPGIDGRLPYYPNISGRLPEPNPGVIPEVFGVTNNGTDFGGVNWQIPQRNAQAFFYELNSLPNVDLVCSIPFSELQDIRVDNFLDTYRDVDGINNLSGRTMIFIDQPSTEDSIVSNVVWVVRYYLDNSNVSRISLVQQYPVNLLEKFTIQFGNQYSNTQWYKNNFGELEQIPLLFAVNDVFAYQDSKDPLMVGTIELTDQSEVATLNISDILGHKNYVSPNGVVFTNGLVVNFEGPTEPPEYQNNVYYVEGVGSSIVLMPKDYFVTPEPYTISATVPYDSTLYDETPYAASLDAPLQPDYVTINRGSFDYNAWSRSNRWFHVDVLYATAKYNNTPLIINSAYRARRPIIEFRANTRLFNYGTEGQKFINAIDFNSTDALRDVAGKTGYTIDGYPLVNGSRVIFAGDKDINIRNKIYQVELISPQNGDDPFPANITEQPIIRLVEVGVMLFDQVVVVANGINTQGSSWTYDGKNYIRSQDKTSLNQAPLFDVYDPQGISFGDKIKYPSSTFRGSKLFSYAAGTGAADPVLGIPLQYYSLLNLADIVFDNNLYTDTFVYVNNNVGETVNVNTGFVRQYTDRTTFFTEIGWQPGITKSISRQQFRFVYDGTPLQLDIPVVEENIVPPIQMYINSKFNQPANYTYTTVEGKTSITLVSKNAVIGDIIEVQVISNEVSEQGFYTVPMNLENNALNMNSPTFTSGTIRSHYQTICENLLTLQGPIDGANNTRDLGNLVPYGLQILQQSAPLTLAGYFMRSEDYDIFGALEYNSREYIKFKNQLLENVVTNDYGSMTIPQILDAAILDITYGRTDLSPFYWSDMLPTGPVFSQTKVTVNPLTTPTFNTKQMYNYTSANYQGLLVYLNGRLLVRGVEYTVSTNSATFTITIPLNIGDVVVYDEYNNTQGSFVPNTPSKMGLYPKYVPELYYDETFINPTWVIRGHDGSKTIAFEDYRTQVLLEFEKRIYSNIKLDGNPVPLTTAAVEPGFFTPGSLNVLPGYFRGTMYSNDEVNSILNESFLAWVGANKLDYRTQQYEPNNPFTWNYSQAGNKLTETPLLGAWKGIYRYFYDTETPNTTPWEMLGFSERPTWWIDQYGPAPYTSGNLVLWDDLELGYVADPAGGYILPEYARPGLSKVIPVGPMGELLPPSQSVMGSYDPGTFKKSWTANDGGPVEASWWASSSYPFAAMRLLILTRPAEFFSLFADRDLYKYDKSFGQYLYNGRFRLDANGVQIYGDGTSKASYINWIVDYNKQLGINSTKKLTAELQNLDVRLMYRMASFSDKGYMQIYSERSSPNSDNTSLRIPDQSYQLLLYKNVPFSEIVYSSVVVEVVENGYQVYGYSNIQPFFTVQVSASNGLLRSITVQDKTVQVPAQYTDLTANIPYGTTFINDAAVADFILSYGQYLTNQGLLYEDRENGYTLNWNQMVSEFLYFAQQGWSVGTLINLNPSSTTLRAVRPGAVVDTILSLTPENMLLDQNRGVIPTRDLVIERYGNEFSVSSSPSQSISFLQLKFTSFEHIIVLDNKTVFSDLIYDPITAARQTRLKLVAATTTDWNGTLDAQGFILNDNNVKQWQANKKYAKGEIVIYKNIYYSAQTIVQPKVEFNYADWVKSEYSIIQKGLLPNIANKADQLANTYNTQVANLDIDNDLFAYGLIGYRPRQYMAALNLDQATQVQLYQQFLGTKGTIRAAEIFTRAQFGTQSGQYEIYENWATLTATYGAQANKSFVEYRLNAALLQSNPSTVQIISPAQVSEANQKINLSDVWRESYKLTSPDILPTTYATDPNTALPSAGYVNFKDVDITVFSFNDPANISAQLDNIGVGTVIWVAKTNSYDWGIFRCEPVTGQITQVTDNMNATAVVTFNNTHGLSVGDTIIIKFFNESINGVYRVLSVPSITTIIIAYDFNNSSQTIVRGSGLAFYLQTMRVKQASDIYTLPYANKLVPGAKVWVDDDGTGKWVVLQKQEPFVFGQTIAGAANINYGASVAQSNNLLNLFVGAPNYDTAPGEVYAYIRDDAGVIKFNKKLTLPVTGTSGFGNSLCFGDLNWAIAGASRSANGIGYAAIVYQNPEYIGFNINQLLMPRTLDDELDTTTQNFGSSVVMNKEETWAYVSAPLQNKVYAYGINPVQKQFVKYEGDGINKEFNYSSGIVVELAAQLVVVVGDGAELEPNTQYTIDPNVGIVIFADAPAVGEEITISRRQVERYGYTAYYNISPIYDQTSPAFDGTGAELTVVNSTGLYYIGFSSYGTNYEVDDILRVYGSQVGGTSPTNDILITITAVSDTGAIESFTYTNATAADPSWTNIAIRDSLYTITDGYSFNVIVNGNIYRWGIDYTYDATNDALTFLTIPAKASVIMIDAADYWSLAGIIDGNALPFKEGVTTNSMFGQSVDTNKDGDTIIIGAPFADGSEVETGAAYVFNRSVLEYVVLDPQEVTYVLPVNVTAPISVRLNGELLINNQGNIGGHYDITFGSTTVVTLTMDVVRGDIVQIDTNQFTFVEKISPNNNIEPSYFGDAVAIDTIGSNVYASAPKDSSILLEAGSVERLVSYPQVYGVIESNVYNPVLTSGDTLRINNVQVTVPGTLGVDTATVAELVTVINESNIPNVTAVESPNETFLADGQTQSFYIGDLYGKETNPNTVVYLGGVLQVVGIDYTYDSSTQTINFIDTPEANLTVLIVSGRLILSVINKMASDANNLLTVLPGTVSVSADGAFNTLGFSIYVWTQTITSPYPVTYAQFGQAITTSPEGTTLVVGAPRGSTYEPMVFDLNKTTFDDKATTFFNPVEESGVVYTFDYLPSASDAIGQTGKFIFGEQIYPTGIASGDLFGTALVYIEGEMTVTAPNATTSNVGYVSIFNNARDRAAWFPIYNQLPAVDIPLINDIYLYNRLISSTQTYLDFFDPLQGKILSAARRNIDFIGAVDPADYNEGSIHNFGSSWGNEHVGEIWWDTDTVRFVDPNQDDIVYASRRWGQTFPGSRVDIYQWISSSVPPSSYTGPGTPLSTTSYSVKAYLNQENIFVTEYFFWVRGITTIATGSGKTLSPVAIEAYILSPRSSGIPYLAPLSASSVALYNCLDYLSAFDTILHIDYDREFNDDNIHNEYKLIADGKENAFLSDSLYRKMIDSFCGADTAGNNVPDPTLSPPERYGVQFRPRQGMFVDRYAALENYLTHCNTVLAQFPISETKSFALLNTADPLPSPTSGAYDKAVANLQELYFQDIDAVAIGYKYLVETDSSTNGLWAIYIVEGNEYPFVTPAETAPDVQGTDSVFSVDVRTASYDLSLVDGGVDYNVGDNIKILGSQVGGIAGINDITITILSVGIGGRILTFSWEGIGTRPHYLQLYVVQNYDTKQYWNYINWYRAGYNSTIQPIAEVPNYTALDTLSIKTVPPGSSVRVTANSQGYWEIYLRTDIGWERVGLQDGTIEFNEKLWNYQAGRFGFDGEVFDAQYFDQEPTIETRQVIRAINEELFTDELLIERNRALMIMFHFVYSEFSAPNWLIKTSLIDVTHEVAKLQPLQIYQQDNQDFVLDYIKEVKPYHVQIREFGLAYSGDDTWAGSATDFDCPAFYDNELTLPQFISPILLPYTHAQTPVYSDVSDRDGNAQVWALTPWKDWYTNYSLTVEYVDVIQSPEIYTSLPTITPISTGTIVAAKFLAVLNTEGKISSVTVLNPGKYISAVELVVTGGGVTTQARMFARLTSPFVRSMKTTIKYDRTQYRSDVTPWEANIDYPVGTLVRYSNQVFELVTPVPVQDRETFIFTYFKLVPPSGLPSQYASLPQWVSTTAYALGSQVLYQGCAWQAITDTTPLIFEYNQWQLIYQPLSGVNRTMGYYVPGADMPGLSLPLLIDGVEYPGVQVFGPAYTADTNNILQYKPEALDAIYRSEYTDVDLGNRPTDVNVAGGNYLSYFASYAPEELVPGEEFDTLDFKVKSRIGQAAILADWGFPIKAASFTITNKATQTYYYGNDLPIIVEVSVSNTTTGRVLTAGVDYTINWISNTITSFNTAAFTNGDTVSVTTYGIGGGNELFVQNYNGGVVYSSGNTITIPVGYDELIPPVSFGANPAGLTLFIDGVITNNYTVPLELTTPTTITIVLNNDWENHQITVVAIGPTYKDVYPGPSLPLQWSTSQTEIVSASSSAGVTSYEMINSMNTTNSVNSVVMINGLRVRTAGGIEFTGDGSRVLFHTADRLGYAYGTDVPEADVVVYVNSILQTAGVDYTFPTPLFGQTTRPVQFVTAPVAGTQVLIYVTSIGLALPPSPPVYLKCSATITGQTLTFANAPNTGSEIKVVSWNDTTQQNILTQVFVGPGAKNVVIEEGFDSTPYDPDFIGGGNPLDPAGGGGRNPSTDDFNGEPGSYDYRNFIVVPDNQLTLARPVTDLSRLWVTLNGKILAGGNDFTIENNLIILNKNLLPATDGLMSATDLVMVEYCTETTVSAAAEFRIFKDMRDLALNYRITDQNTTTLAQALTVPEDPGYEDVIYVTDAAGLPVPNLAENIWGAVIINGERIMYREIDKNANTLSGLLRGTAGTATATHAVDTIVYSVGVADLFALEYQNYVVKTSTIVEDIDQTEFVAPNIVIN